MDSFPHFKIADRISTLVAQVEVRASGSGINEVVPMVIYGLVVVLWLKWTLSPTLSLLTGSHPL